MKYTVVDSSLGCCLIAATERGVCAVMLGDRKDDLVAELKLRSDHAFSAVTEGQLRDHVVGVQSQIEGQAPVHPVPTDVRGTPFQQRVWQALREIPRGQTSSYARVARSIDAPGAVRAVAGACAANPVAILVPCHRVLRSDGTLSGYRWGPERKRALLEREAPRSHPDGTSEVNA